MDESKATPRAVVLSAILHLGIVGFLALAILPCSFYEDVFETLHLPATWNPIACAKPLELPGQIIEANTLDAFANVLRKPGDTRRIFGMLLTVIAAVAMSPCSPPAIFCVMRGLPSMRRIK